MRKSGVVALVTGVGAAGAARALSRRRQVKGRSDHWLAVTVNEGPANVGSPWPEPLARLGGGVELRTRPAAGDKGTEVLARPVGDAVSRADLRIALRQSKSLIETGEVLRPHSPPTTHPGPAGKVLSAIVGKSRGEGRL